MYFPRFLGDWTFIVNGRKRSYVLHAKLQEEAIRWANAIQEVCVTELKTIMCLSLDVKYVFIGPGKTLS